ncbi:unnamed protein product [Durusdinium trenchii]|uniref:Uncharacterized protein n=1 Tax=Durusdinium trenchii TaxID=1381693 RepID=A0ABP0ISP0_9DINO
MQLTATPRNGTFATATLRICLGRKRQLRHGETLWICLAWATVSPCGVPGPGTYHPKELGSEPALEMQPAVKPILKDQEKTTPSMPPMRYLPGQVPMTEAAAADLSKLSSRHTGEPGDMAGPGTYELQSRLIKDSPVPVFRKPPGRHFRKLWEASAAIESKMPPKDLPGPGAYEPEVKDSAKGAASQFNSKVPKIPKDSSKTPGPGAYDVLGHIEKASAETQDRKRMRPWLWLPDGARGLVPRCEASLRGSLQRGPCAWTRTLHRWCQCQGHAGEREGRA